MHRHNSGNSPLFERLDPEAKMPQRQTEVSMNEGIEIFIAVDMREMIIGEDCSRSLHMRDDTNPGVM